MENRAFAPKEQLLPFIHNIFQIHDISKASKGVITEYRVKLTEYFSNPVS